MIRLTKEEFIMFREAFSIGMRTWARHPAYKGDLAIIRRILIDMPEEDFVTVPEEVDLDYLWLIFTTAFTATEFDNPPLAEFIHGILDVLRQMEAEEGKDG